MDPLDLAAFAMAMGVAQEDPEGVRELFKVAGVTLPYPQISESPLVKQAAEIGRRMAQLDFEKKAGLMAGMARGVSKVLKPAGAAAAAAPAVAKAVPAAAAASKPLVSLGTKAKVVAGAGLIGAGYAGYKGLGAAKDYMSIPTAQSKWGYGGPTPKSGVNEYGVPQ